MRGLAVVMVMMACGRGGTAVEGERGAARDGGDGVVNGSAGGEAAEGGVAIGDDGMAAVLDELVHAVARGDEVDELASVMGTVMGRLGRVVVVRPRPAWLLGARIGLRADGEAATDVQLELAEAATREALATAMGLSPEPMVEGPRVRAVEFADGAVEVSMDGPAMAERRLRLRWVSGRQWPQGPASWEVKLGALIDELRDEGPDELAPRLGLRRPGARIAVSPRPRWLAGADVRQEDAVGGKRTVVDLALAEAIDPPRLARKLDLQAVPGRSGTFVPVPGTLAALEGELEVAVAPGRPGERVKQRVTMRWRAFERPRVPAPPPEIVATPWFALVQELQRRLGRDEDADAVQAWLRGAQDPVARPWLRRAAVQRAADAPRSVEHVTLDVEPAIAVAELIAAFGHYEELVPIHFRDEPLELAFDPIVVGRGTLTIVTMLEEPGTRAPHGTVRRLELRWTAASPASAGRRHGR